MRRVWRTIAIDRSSRGRDLSISADHKSEPESGDADAQSQQRASSAPHRCSPRVANAPRLPLLPRARVWISAQHLFKRAEAQACCWLWMLHADGRVFALRMSAEHLGCDTLLPRLLVRLHADPETPVQLGDRTDLAWPLPHASIVPALRWSASWGHPLQGEIRAFTRLLDRTVLRALGQLEAAGPFFGSVSNYNRLTRIPQPARRHRLQALAEFPPLVAPLLLDTLSRPDQFGTDEDEPVHRAAYLSQALAPFLDACDRGRDLIGALAAYHHVDRALIRSRLFRQAWQSGHAPRDLLSLLAAMPAHARPRDHASLAQWMPCLRALPLEWQQPADCARLARVFTPDWLAFWQAQHGPGNTLAPRLRDTRDFLDDALAHAFDKGAPRWLDLPRLCLAWLARRGLDSLLAASQRWHRQPVIERTADDGLPDNLPLIVGELRCATGVAMELGSRDALFEEGRSMRHCVGSYWRECVLEATRIAHITTDQGETATAQYKLDEILPNPCYELVALRGPDNDDCSNAQYQVAEDMQYALNSNRHATQRRQAFENARQARQDWSPDKVRRIARALDRRTSRELVLVLDWCLKQDDWRARERELYSGPVAGFGYTEGPDLLPRIRVGDKLDLVREPDNPHDPRAVRIDWHNHKLGYIPQSHNADIARLLDQGTLLDTQITRIEPEPESYSPVHLSVSPSAASSAAPGTPPHRQ